MTLQEAARITSHRRASATRDQAAIGAVRVGAARGYRIAASTPPLAKPGWGGMAAAGSGCPPWLVVSPYSPLRGTRSALRRKIFPAVMSALCRGVADVTPLAEGWSGAANFLASAVQWPSNGPVVAESCDLCPGVMDNFFGFRQIVVTECRRREVSPGLASGTCLLAKGSSGRWPAAVRGPFAELIHASPHRWNSRTWLLAD